MRLPFTTAFVAAIALAQCPSVDLLEYDRAAVAAGEVWRPFTGQLVHWSLRMALCDVGVSAAACAALELRSRRAAGSALVLALAAVAAAVHWAPPRFESFRGSSGLAAGLFSALLVLLFATGRTAQRGLAAALCVLFALKLVFEASGSPLFAGPLPTGVAVAPAAHAAGALAGLAAGLVGLCRPRPSS